MAKIIKREIIELDATGMSVGRLSTKVAMILQGKNKAEYAPYLDCGDFVVVKNAGAVKFTGKKLVQKDYYHHSMHPGGIKRISMKKVFDQNPGKVIEMAVERMLPKNKLQVKMMKRLTVKV